MSSRVTTVALGIGVLALALALGAACSSSSGGTKKLDVSGVAQNGMTLGSGGAQIDLYENLFCETCALFAKNVLPGLVEDYVKPGKVSITFVDTPLGTAAETVFVHEAAHCAADQGKLWEFIEEVFKEQKSANFTKDSIKQIAGTVGLDHSTFDPCLDNDQYKDAVNAGLAQFDALRGDKQLRLPVLHINEEIMAGSTSYDDVKLLLQDELQ